MINTKKVVELVELSLESGARVDVDIRDYENRGDALVFAEVLFKELNTPFTESDSYKIGWFESVIEDCTISVIYQKEEALRRKRYERT